MKGLVDDGIIKVKKEEEKEWHESMREADLE
jgi:hypothetical protein